jgi:hypothetical protein
MCVHTCAYFLYAEANQIRTGKGMVRIESRKTFLGEKSILSLALFRKE